MLPVPGPGYRGRVWTGLGRNANANGTKSGPELPVRISFPHSRPETGPDSPARGPEALLSNLRYTNHIRILNCSFDGGTENVTKWHYSLLG
jgi:hypothetical protein